MDKFGRYEILYELGRGGMATVYLAQDPAFGRQVAIKVLPPQFTHDPKFRARFLREAKVIAALENPYIVPVYDYGEEDAYPFIVMRYMPGGTLNDRLAHGPMPLGTVSQIVGRVADALDEAHKHNIVHRDLKPSNVLFDPRNEAFLSDFGLAKLSEGSTKLTFTGVMVGTPDYMSPEQAVGDDDIDPRSDVYSLGVILYEMLAGHLPYEAGTPMKLLFKHINEPVPQLDTAQLGLPVECNAILASAMAKNREDRYPTAGMLADVLRRLAAGVPVRPAARSALPWPAVPNRTGSVAPGSLPRVSAGQGAPAAPALQRYSPWLLAALGVPLVVGIFGLAVLLYTGSLLPPIPTPIPTSSPTHTAQPTPTLLPAMLTASAPAPTPTFVPPSATLVLPPTDTETPVPTDTVTPPPTLTATATRRPPTRPPATNTPVPPTATSPVSPTQAPTSPPPANTEPPPPPPTAVPPTNTPQPPPTS